MTALSSDSDPSAVLTEACLNAAKALGLTQNQLSQVVGRDRSRLKSGIRPDNKAGELALLLIRCYRGLYALVDGDETMMKHWMRSQNHGTGGIPIKQIQTVAGLAAVVSYLDAIRGKV